MLIEQQKAKEIVILEDSSTGARIGDKIIFSSHNEENKKVAERLKQCSVALNKVYVIAGIGTYGNSFFMNELNIKSNCGSKGHIGQYDIIEYAEQPEIVKAFQPVTMTLESQGEVDMLASLLSATSLAFEKAFNCGDTYPGYRQLEALASNDRQSCDVILV